TDVDNTANTFTPVTTLTASTNGYGNYTMTAGGVWSYTLKNNNATLQALNVGDTLSDTFTVSTIDGTPQIVTIVIHGTNDAAVIAGTSTGYVIEAIGLANAIPTILPTRRSSDLTDVDNTANTFTPVTTLTASTNGYGNYTMTADGVWSYTL